MKKFLIQFSFVFGILLGSTSSQALTDNYFATGQDLDFLIETDSTLGLREIEYKLRRFVIFRKIEGFILSFDDDYTESN